MPRHALYLTVTSNLSSKPSLTPGEALEPSMELWPATRSGPPPSSNGRIEALMSVVDRMRPAGATGRLAASCQYAAACGVCSRDAAPDCTGHRRACNLAEADMRASRFADALLYHVVDLLSLRMLLTSARRGRCMPA